MPVVFKKPVFDHELFTSSRMRVFGPHLDPWRLSEIHAFADASAVLLGPQPESPDYPTFLYRVSTLALIEEYRYGIFPRPLPGPLDPWLLNVLERYRIKNNDLSISYFYFSIFAFVRENEFEKAEGIGTATC